MTIKELEFYNKGVAAKYLKDHNDAPMKILEIKEKLPIKIKRRELLLILNDLENKGKIIIGTKGILWIFSEREELNLLISRGIEI